MDAHMLILLAVSFLLISTRNSAEETKSLNPVLSWKKLVYGFRNDSDREYAIENGLYEDNTGFPIDVGVHYSKRGSLSIFITIPRFQNGIPYTLAYVSTVVTSNGPIIYPYPSYEWHFRKNLSCFGFISAFRVAIDQCNQMWVIDSGIVANKQICPPKLFIIDLTNDRVFYRYEFPSNMYVPISSLFITPIVDVRDPPPFGRCQNTMVYIADALNHGLVVFDYQRKVSWRIENKRMYPDPDWGTHSIAGQSFDQMGGIFAINVSPRNGRGRYFTGERQLFFHALASDSEISVPLRLIDNQTLWYDNPGAERNQFRVIGRRGVQSVMEAIDSNGNIFANTNNLEIFAWNINTPYRKRYFKTVANDSEQLQFASGIKVVNHPNGFEELWVSSCRYQKYATGTFNPKETNYRVMTCRIGNLLRDIDCKHLGQQGLYYIN